MRIYMFVTLLLLLVNPLKSNVNTSDAQYDELPFVIHICSFNNSPWVERNLDSLFMQQYTNYRVIYVDDQSDDGTAELVRDYIKKHRVADKVTLVENKVRARKMKNMYSTMRLCEDHEIIVQLDGDDWFSDDQVLNRLNKAYQTQDIWLTYGSYNDYPSNKRGYCAPTPPLWVERKLFRKRKWLYMHPRSFYAWLFKAIKVQDHICELAKDYQGQFYPSADDQTSFWCMIEMAGNRFAYLPEISYICNRGNPLSGRIFENPLQSACGGDARRRAPYETLEEPLIFKAEECAQRKVDVILISTNYPKGAAATLHSFKKHLDGINSVTLCYAVDKIDASGYRSLETKFPWVRCVRCDDGALFEQIAYQVEQSGADYILLARDKMRLLEDLSIRTYVSDLESTQAYGVYFAFTPDQAPFFDTKKQRDAISYVHLYDDIYAWKFCCGKFALFNNIDLTLMRKHDVLDRIAQLMRHREMQSIESFYRIWQTDTALDQHQIGLFCQKSPLDGVRTPISTVIPLPKCIRKKKQNGQFNFLEYERKLYEQWEERKGKK